MSPASTLSCQDADRRAPGWRLTDLAPAPADLRSDALAGLRATPKRLPSKYFYDAQGSRLFEAITRQPEYYLTRVETGLLDASLAAIAHRVGGGAHVVELGTGSGAKTERLLRGLDAPVAYTAVDISREALVDTAVRLQQRFPRLELLPVCADFSRAVPLPAPEATARRTLAFFPGSTLGNFEEPDAVRLLAAMRAMIAPHGLALVGVDLVKAPARLEAAYNDAAGVTAAFTLNLLARLNREAGADFDLQRYAHRATWSAARERIETAIVSRARQAVTVAGQRIDFGEGERIEVEISQKYTDASMRRLAGRAGLAVDATWKDGAGDFALVLLRDARPPEG